MAARYPTPITVSIGSGSPSLRRSRAMVTVTVRENRSVLSSQTRSNRSSALRMPPSAISSSSSTPSSLRLSGTGRPARLTRRLARSSTMSAAGDHRGRGRAAAGERADPGDEFGERERLGQVVVGAEVEAVHPVAHRARRGQHQDAGLRRRADQRGADRVAVDAGQVTVQDDDVVGVQQRLLDGGRAVVGHVRADALVAQAVGDVVGQFGLILDHEHPHEAIVPQAGSHGHHKRPRAQAGRGDSDLALPGRRAPGARPRV